MYTPMTGPIRKSFTIRNSRSHGKSLYEETDFALTCQFGGHLFEMGQFLLGFEDYLAYLHMEPEIVEAIMDKTRRYRCRWKPWSCRPSENI